MGYSLDDFMCEVSCEEAYGSGFEEVLNQYLFNGSESELDDVEQEERQEYEKGTFFN